MISDFLDIKAWRPGEKHILLIALRPLRMTTPDQDLSIMAQALEQSGEYRVPADWLIHIAKRAEF